MNKQMQKLFRPRISQALMAGGTNGRALEVRVRDIERRDAERLACYRLSAGSSQYARIQFGICHTDNFFDERNRLCSYQHKRATWILPLPAKLFSIAFAQRTAVLSSRRRMNAAQHKTICAIIPPG